MAGLILDASGTIKMKVLEDALLLVQRLVALNEQYAINAKAGTPSSSLVANMKRQLQTLAANLKSHFGMISDLVTNVIISSSRGASDVNRVRALREGLAQIRQAIDIGMAHTKEKHAVHREKPVAAPVRDTPTADGNGSAA
ncbi:MAG TPA: hypothetical protein VFO55_05515 [Gemmatimonadaceae bacterium]|nr:hypothetical protein [Gemmatimonadaceae bacterium]